MDEMAAAFFSEFLVELIKLVVLGVVAVAAIFLGALRDRKTQNKLLFWRNDCGKI